MVWYDDILVLPLTGELPVQGLHHWEVLQSPALPCDPSSPEWCQHDWYSTPTLLHRYQGLLIFWRYYHHFQILSWFGNHLYYFEEFAKYIVRVSEDDALFASYFWWKEYYRASRCDNRQGMEIFCYSFTQVARYSTTQRLLHMLSLRPTVNSVRNYMRNQRRRKLY